MRQIITFAASALMLAGCADVAGGPSVIDPVPLRSDVSEQNRFVPPPGGFGAASAAAASGAPMQAPMGGPAMPGSPAAGFVPLDDGGFAAGATAAGAAEATGPNIIEYALSTSHPVGTPRYRRGNPLRWQTWERNCQRFPSQDAAQEAFLAAGGPERDRRNLDPDGDGYACWWTPEPIRRALQAGG